jgi:predicted metallo-beta-lactamase superfamily hydrolase
MIDPAATLGVRRFGLKPSPGEIEAWDRAIGRISTYAVRASFLFVSHYHEDHVRTDPDLYRGRRVWAKDPERHIHGEQRRRAQEFWSRIQPVASYLERAEGRYFEFADATVKASPALPHGPDGSPFGSVTALTVNDGLRFVFASDVQGPCSAVVRAYLIRERPDLLYLSGPPTYLEGQVGAEEIRRGIECLLEIIDATGCQVILDHHALRDRHHREKLGRLYETGKVLSAAEYLGMPEELLEAHRPDLWARERRRVSAEEPRRTRKKSPAP